MTSAIVLPPLPTWAEQHLTALIQAKTQDDFNTAFDNFISQNVEITFNGAPLTRDQYKQQLQSERFLERSASIAIKNVVSAPKLNTQASATAGLVGIFYDATFFERIVVRDAAQVHTVQSSLNIQVAQDTLIPLPPPSIHGDVDRRRVVKLDQVLIDQPANPSNTN